MALWTKRKLEELTRLERDVLGGSNPLSATSNLAMCTKRKLEELIDSKSNVLGGSNPLMATTAVWTKAK